MPDKDSKISEIRDDIGAILDPKNLSTMALPWVSFARTMVQIAKEDTKNYTYVNPVNKLIINNYLGASMVLRQTNLGKKIYEQFDIGPGAGKQVFEAVTESWVKAVSGAGNLLEAKEIMLTAVIDELQTVRKRADDAAGAAGDGGTDGDRGADETGGTTGDGGVGPRPRTRRIK